MAVVASVCGIVLIVVVLWEGFETIILPRRVIRRFRLTHLFYQHTWRPWAKLVTSLAPPQRQETWLSYFGPLSILVLLAIWAGMMILGYALLQWALGSAVLIHNGSTGFRIDLYMSATTFFTLGLGDAIPASALGHFLVAIESGSDAPSADNTRRKPKENISKRADIAEPLVADLAVQASDGLSISHLLVHPGSATRSSKRWPRRLPMGQFPH
jgi:hypothetical protein